MKKTAVIIGAGPAGLTAAYQLIKESNIQPIIIEKEALAGGISRTVNYNGNRIDIGGHRFFSKSMEVVDLWRELMPVQGKPSKDDLVLKIEKPLNPGGPDPEEEDEVFLVRSRVSRILYLRKFFDYPISLKVQTLTNLGFGNTIKAGLTYVKSQVFKREEATLEDFMVNRFGTALYKMFFKDYTCKVWGRDPSEISADWGAQRIKSLSLIKAVVHILKKPLMRKDVSQNKMETSLIELFTYPKKGPGQYWELMAEKIIQAGGEIHFNSKVIGIDLEQGQIKSVLVEAGSELEHYRGDYFISTMPISELFGALQDEVPEEIRETALNLPYRDFITVGLLVDKLKIKNTTKIKTFSKRVPDCWIYVQEPDVKVGRIQVFNNWSPYMVKDFENTVWIGLEYFCNEGDELWRLGKDEFIAYAIGEAEKIGLIEKGTVLDSIQIKVEKAYPAYFGTYNNFHVVKDHLDGYANLYCIGRNGQHRYNNMDHSMLTALEAVNLITSGVSSKETLWKVNTESDYHEERENE